MTDPPTAADFQSRATVGRFPPPEGTNQQRLWRGVSVYDEEGRARTTALRYPALGTYIAALEVEEGGISNTNGPPEVPAITRCGQTQPPRTGAWLRTSWSWDGSMIRMTAGANR